MRAHIIEVKLNDGRTARAIHDIVTRGPISAEQFTSNALGALIHAYGRESFSDYNYYTID